MRRTSILLIIVILLAGMAGCSPSPVEYALAITSTEGGSVTTPGEGIFSYDEGAVVNLITEAEDGYWLVEWSGDTDTVANVHAASTTITMNGDYSIAANFQKDEVVQFADPNLEAVIREAIGKPTGDIYASELVNLTHLAAIDRGIRDLSGIEYCTSLSEAILGPEMFASGLSLDSVSLTEQGTGQPNQISDLSPLSYCGNITYLCLWNNNISDISPLANLTNPTRLYLYNNQIMDISPLVQNEGIDAGDIVRLADNLLSEDSINIYIPQLQARGVDVTW